MTPPAAASPADEYDGPYFGADNFPPGCIRDMSLSNPANICHHMRTDMNGLDSPQVDVLVMVPVSPTAERDMRIMRQSVEMWEAGIDYLAPEMGLDWLGDGVDFHITVDSFDPDGGGGEATTYPIVDPEIVVIATNPVGGAGIGVDPVDFVFTNQNLVPCHNVQNPFDFEYWENLPGFDRHHDDRSGTYVEDCGGAGGNICFAVNGAIDPAPEAVDVFGLYDLVSHEFGHCMTVGHVGDGLEGSWGAVPTNDIMAYSKDPAHLNKCVSTLDVEGVALRMSSYLDVNGDGSVDSGDRLLANDQIGDGSSPFQVQHPDDHLYASSTGSPFDCPQPNLGTVPGERTDWTPTPAETTESVLTVTAPQDGATSADGRFDVTGTVERVRLGDPTEPAGSFDDADDDASTPITEILALDVDVDATHVSAAMRLAELWPSTDVASATSYSVLVDGRKFDSFVRYAVDANPRTWDSDAGAYMPAGTSTWDLAAKTVTFRIPRDYLAAAGIEAPFFVGSQSNFGLLSTAVVDDRAPEAGDSVGVAGARVVEVGAPEVEGGAELRTVTFDHEGGNTFSAGDSTLGVPPFPVDRGTDHGFGLDVADTSDVEFTMTWTDGVGGTDLDVYVTGAADSGSSGATTATTETFVLEDVRGFLEIRVEPYLVTDVLEGTTYTLTATLTPAGNGRDSDGDGILDADDACPSDPGVAPTGCPDADGDGVSDGDDVCPDMAGSGADGCPVLATEHVSVYVDGVHAATEDVDTANGRDSFAMAVAVQPGTHSLRIDWERRGEVVASRVVSVSYDNDADDDGIADASDTCAGFDDNADRDGDGIADGCDPDLDGDGVANASDNCVEHANATQTDLDGDGKGDACDTDIDGDGYSNGKERSAGTDPADARSFPTKDGKLKM